MNSKMKKVVLVLLLALTIVIVPRMSVSKENKTETIVLGADNLLVLNSEVNGESAGALILKAKELDAKLSCRLGLHGAPLYLYLNTPGGYISNGLEIIEALKGLGRPVHTITYFAASMGFQIVENLDNRYILQSGVLMSHRATGSAEGSLGGTAPSQIEQRLHLSIQLTKEMDEQTVSRTNGKQTLESYQAAYQNELWMTGQESIVGGYADSIVHVKCGKSLSGTTTHQTEFLGMPISYELDNCPINSAPLNIRVGSIAPMSAEYVDRVKSQFISNFEMKASAPRPMTY